MILHENMKNKITQKSSTKKTGIKNACFSFHESKNIACKKLDCRHWIEYSDCQNCVLISAKSGPKTLQVIGDMYGITRMRICQIEKNVIHKLTKKKKIFES